MAGVPATGQRVHSAAGDAATGARGPSTAGGAPATGPRGASPTGQHSSSESEIQLASSGELLLDVKEVDAGEQATLIKNRNEENANEKKAPLLPIFNKEILLEYLPSLASAVFLGVTAINVLTSNQTQDGLRVSGLSTFLRSMPYTLFFTYTLFFVGLVGLGIAMATKKKPHLLGCAAGILLGQLLCLVLMGALVTLVRTEVRSVFVWKATAVIMVLLVIAWSMLCAYPKFLRCQCFCFAKKEAGETELAVAATRQAPGGGGTHRTQDNIV